MLLPTCKSNNIVKPNSGPTGMSHPTLYVSIKVDEYWEYEDLQLRAPKETDCDFLSFSFIISLLPI